MKRLLSLLALLVSLCALAPGAFSDGEGLPVPAGDALRGYSKKEGYVYVSLGAYPTDGDGTVRPILWRVLSTDGISAYLLSEYILEAGRIHSDRNTYRSSKSENREDAQSDGHQRGCDSHRRLALSGPAW